MSWRRIWTPRPRTCDARSHHTNALPILERANDVDDVVRNLNQIIDWATAEQSTIGYFAVLYKRSTMAIRDAIDRDLFENSALMAEFDVVFAQRYFDALNAYLPSRRVPGSQSRLGGRLRRTRQPRDDDAPADARRAERPHLLRSGRRRGDGRTEPASGAEARFRPHHRRGGHPDPRDDGRVRAAVAGVSLGALVIAGAVGATTAAIKGCM